MAATGVRDGTDGTTSDGLGHSDLPAAVHRCWDGRASPAWAVVGVFELPAPGSASAPAVTPTTRRRRRAQARAAGSGLRRGGPVGPPRLD